MHLVVYGNPAPQGSKKFMGRTATGRGIIVDSSANTKPWRADVKEAAERYMERYGVPTITGAVQVRMVFTFLRPKSVRPNKRPHPSVAPDLSKLARSTEDALTAAGVWSDDCLVVEYTRLAKVYANEDREALARSGCQILVVEAGSATPMPGWIGPVLEIEAA